VTWRIKYVGRFRTDPMELKCDKGVCYASHLAIKWQHMNCSFFVHVSNRLCGNGGITVFSIPLMYSKKFQRENGVMWQNFQNSKSYWKMYDCVEEDKEIQMKVMIQKMDTVKKVRRDCPVSIWPIIRE